MLLLAASSARKLPEQPVPQLSAQFLRHPNDVCADSRLQIVQAFGEEGLVCPSYSLHLPRSRSSWIQQHVCSSNNLLLMLIGHK